MVEKIMRYAKFMICIILMVSLVAPSYAALSASDGSAFVTKAEFDSALADFNARLTTFEAGINSKIDSQVSSYLDRNGIWNGKDTLGDLYNYSATRNELKVIWNHATKMPEDRNVSPVDFSWVQDYFDVQTNIPMLGWDEKLNLLSYMFEDRVTSMSKPTDVAVKCVYTNYKMTSLVWDKTSFSKNALPGTAIVANKTGLMDICVCAGVSPFYANRVVFYSNSSGAWDSPQNRGLSFDWINKTTKETYTNVPLTTPATGSGFNSTTSYDTRANGLIEWNSSQKKFKVTTPTTWMWNTYYPEYNTNVYPPSMRYQWQGRDIHSFFFVNKGDQITMSITIDLDYYSAWFVNNWSNAFNTIWLKKAIIY